MRAPHQSVRVSEEDRGIGVILEIGAIILCREPGCSSDDDLPAGGGVRCCRLEHLTEVVLEFGASTPWYEQDHLLPLYVLGVSL